MSDMPAFLARLSPRERGLVALAGALISALALVYGVLKPGLDARSSAESRHARAVADLSEAHSLADDVATSDPTPQLLEALSSSATAHGLTVIDAQLVDGQAVLRIASVSSRDVLAWAATASHSALPLHSLTMARAGAGSLAIDATFSGKVS